MALSRQSHRPIRHRSLVAVVATLAISCVSFTGVSSPSSASAAASNTIIGAVRDTAGAPVAGASVVVHGSPDHEAHTQVDGTYRIADAPGGEQTLDVSPVCKPPLSQAVAVNGNKTVNFTVQERNTFDSFAYACRPIRAFGFGTTNVTGLTGDDAVKAVSLPFSFPFYGAQRTSAFVSTNGFLSFTTPSTAFANTAIPIAGGPDAAIYAFWDDLVIDGSAAVSTTLSGVAPFRIFIVSWDEARIRAGAGNDRVTFQIRLFEDGAVEIGYSGINGTPLSEGSSATMGIENDNGSVGVQESLDQQHLLPVSDSAVRYEPNRSPIADTEQVSGTVAPGTKVPLDARPSFDPDGDVLRYAWKQTFGPTTAIVDPASPKTSTTAPKSGNPAYQVRVVDSYGVSATSTVFFTVQAPK